MKYLFILLFLSSCYLGTTQIKTIHVFVALCDNVNQGIVPVPSHLGNGQDTKSNLYWGAMFGIKSFFKNKSKDWTYIKSFGNINDTILERILFKHHSKDIYLIADAYDGAAIKTCTEDFLLASNGQNQASIKNLKTIIPTNGAASLVAYIGHDGLMEFQVDLKYNVTTNQKDAIILACISKDYFAPEIKKANANPILWTTNLMAPEAYSLEAALNGWVINESGIQIKERAAVAYNKYQKCGINGARRLLSTGF